MQQHRLLLLGSGELGKEFTIAAQRLGQYVIAADRYAQAPAMQVADECRVLDMLDGDALDALIADTRPDLIIPEIEAIRTERLYAHEAQGIRVVPSAKAVNYTMDRKAIRDLAAKELGLRTAAYRYASSVDELRDATAIIGFPCVVKPLMSSSGKGQSVLRTAADIEEAFDAASEGRGDGKEVIVEAFVPFESEITLLTVTQKTGETLFCPPIGHVQKHGDYQESWQPAAITKAHLDEACSMAKQVTNALGGAGIWGVEFFLTPEHVYFSELSPRPHDTGMVTLAGTQNLNEFELHLRAILGLPIPQITLVRAGVSHVLLAADDAEGPVRFTGIADALTDAHCEVRLFGKPEARPRRRMGVVLQKGKGNEAIKAIRRKAKANAEKIYVTT